jgi:uncharacterized protein (TIGR03437 family)
VIFRLAGLAALLSCGLFAGAPAITGVVNSASLIAPGRPNYGIAQGSIFNVFGSGLGPATIVAPAFVPLPLTLGGTSVSVTVGGITVSAPLFYSLSTQLAAILPSNTPAGTGTIEVIFGGGTASAAITVVTSNVGIYAIDDSGTHAGVVTFPDYSVVGPNHSATVGSVLTLWATGLGPITGSDAVPPAQVDLGTPIQVYVGGVPAPVSYRGRANFAGLDQINFTVPPGVLPGCRVSVSIQTGGLVSNSVSIAVASGGDVCSDPLIPGPGVSSSAPSYTSAQLDLGTETTVTSTSYQASAYFFKFDGVTSVINSTPSVGSCLVTPDSSVSVMNVAGPVLALDIGSSLTLTPPSGNQTILLPGPGLLSSFQATPSALPPGTYQFSNGAGGKDIGPFDVSFTVTPPLVWTNQSVAAAIDRSKPLTLTWTGGDPDGYVYVSIESGTGPRAVASCVAPVSPGQVTIAPNVLLALIPGSSSGNILIEGGSSRGLRIPGVDTGQVTWSYDTYLSAAFQ